MSKTPPKNNRLAIFASGGGTTANAIIKAAQLRQLGGIEPVLLIASSRSAGALAKAKALNLATAVISRKKFTSQTKFGLGIIKLFEEHKIGLASQNGWLQLTPANAIGYLPKGKFINQHPGPLDGNRAAFGGQGMYGSRVMASLICYYALTGHLVFPEATVHQVTPEYDQGAVTKATQLKADFSKELSFAAPITLAELSTKKSELIALTLAMQTELLPIEHHNVTSALQDIANNSVTPNLRSQPLIPDQNLVPLASAKKLAITLFPKG
jgi:folate-dependent phosphoribosylglycinamide formyltransferase PurN